MTGSIRIIVGLIVVLGATGGMDTATDVQLIPLMGIALAGLYSMYSGVKAQNPCL